MSRDASPAEVAELVSKGGYVYVDVSTEERYAEGHPPGALNVPFELQTRKGTEKNADFLPIFEKLFGKAENLLLGASEPDWATRAASLLRAAGYSNVVPLNAAPAGSETITEGGSYPEVRWRAGLG